MRSVALLAMTLLLVSSTVTAADEKKGFDPSKLVGSAASTGGEYVAKLTAGFFYDTDCKDRNLAGSPMNFICGALGSFSGRTEAEWKAKVTEQLTKISSQLDTMEAGQAQIQRQLTAQHKVMETKFNQVASNVVAATHLVSIEGLWNKYKAQFDKVDKDLEPESMLSFATEIINKNPQTSLDELNALLTTPVLEGQSLVRYPFYEWRLTHVGYPVDQFKAMEVYDFAEKKFADFRARQEKAYLMYLWAAKVFEAQCTLHPDKCVNPPRSTKDLRADYERYTRQQVTAFNAAVDWFVLSYSTARMTTEGNFLPGYNTGQATEMFLRANFMSATILALNGGLWGRVISMGNAWDGSLEVQCGGAAQTLKPVLAYDTPVGGNGVIHSGPDSGAFDWWVSSKGNAVFDEVHFSDNWRIYHYSLPAAPTGPCTVAQNQPGVYLPWVEPGTKVVTLKTLDKRSVPFGSFSAIQRAGGTYALMSGAKWDGSTSPSVTEDGQGTRKKAEYDWFVERDHPSGPWMGLFVKGRGEFNVLNRSSRIHNEHLVKVFQTKLIRFPDDPSVTINFFPGNCKGQFCSTNSSILSYDIENNDTDAKKGQLESFVGVSFRAPDEITFLRPTIYKKDRGMVLNGSYEKTGDRKTLDLKGPQTGVFTPEPGKSYQLTYVMYFDLYTEGRGLDATEYMYRALLAPGSVYLTK